MISNRNKRVARWRRARKVMRGTASCPRMIVHRSNRGIQVHLMDDAAGVMICGVSSLAKSLDVKGSTCESASAVGKEVARKALEHGIETVVFDRNGYVYQGRVKAVAEAAREGGLKF
jgi:large subunit ribosomal protein L18